MGRNPLHLNEQYFSYWIALFRENGAVKDTTATLAIKSIMLAVAELESFTVPAWFYADWLGVFRQQKR